MSANTIYHEEAFNNSEGGRIAVGEIVDSHVYERNWSDVKVPTNLTIVDDTANLMDGNGNAENPIGQTTDLTKDLVFSDSSINADIYVLSGATEVNSGSGSAMLAGYEGLGKSMAKGGVSLYFEMRSVGQGNQNAKATTTSDYKSVVVN